MEEYESSDKTQNTLKNKTKNAKIIVFGLIPFLVLSAMIAFLLSPVGQGFINTGIPLPELTIEKIEFQEFCRCQVEEIKRHKWIESEKAGHDLGRAAVDDWVKKYAKTYREEWEHSHPEKKCDQCGKSVKSA